MIRVIPLFLCTVLLVACGGQDEAVVYEVPKEDPQPPTGSVAPGGPMAATSGTDEDQAPFADASSPGINPMQGESLPEGSLSQEMDNPDWQPPEHWAEQDPGSMRRATFLGSNPAGDFEIAVTSFPGDVGGELANVNRWRGQLEMAPLGEAYLEDALERIEVDGVRVALVHMDNGEFAMHVAMLPYGGDTWFVRLSGSSAAVEYEDTAFREFIASIRF